MGVISGGYGSTELPGRYILMQQAMIALPASACPGSVVDSPCDAL